MIAKDKYQDTACLHAVNRKAQRDSFREAQLVEHGGGGGDGGDGGVRVANQRGTHIHKNSDTQNADTGYTSFTASFQSTEWPPGNPIPPETLATSLLSSPLVVASHTRLEQRERKFSISEEDKASTNGLNGTSSHSARTGLDMSPRSMSLDSTPTVYRNDDDKLRYPRPQSPSISSYVLVSRAEKPAGVTEEDLKLLSRLRKRVKLLRLQVQGQRVLVESKREELSDTDEKYIKWIRTHHVSKEDPEQVNAAEVHELETLWKLCQAARDAYGPAADSLVSLEYGLEVEEDKLEQIEGRVFGHLDVSQPTSRLTNYPMDLEDDTSDDKDRNSSGIQSQASGRTSQVDYNDYLWRLGNLDLLQERYQGLLNERSMLEEEQEKRQRVGLDLDPEDSDFLAHFGDTLEPVKEELAEVAADVERLKQLCIEKGLINNDGNPAQTSAEEVTSTSEPGEETQSELPADHSKLSQHQEPSGNNEPDFKVSDSHGGFGPFINLWLLHKLRSSTMEILLLACFVAASVRSMEGLKWQAEALRLWRQDGTGKNVYGRNDSDVKLSNHQYGTIASDEKAKQIAITRKTLSMRATATQISLSILSYIRPRANSAI